MSDERYKARALRWTGQDRCDSCPTIAIVPCKRYEVCKAVRDLRTRNAELEEIAKAVAHIGIDFGYGEYELEQKYIDKARDLTNE